MGKLFYYLGRLSDGEDNIANYLNEYFMGTQNVKHSTPRTLNFQLRGVNLLESAESAKSTLKKFNLTIEVAEGSNDPSIIRMFFKEHILQVTLTLLPE